MHSDVALGGWESGARGPGREHRPSAHSTLAANQGAGTALGCVAVSPQPWQMERDMGTPAQAWGGMASAPALARGDICPSALCHPILNAVWSGGSWAGEGAPCSCATSSAWCPQPECCGLIALGTGRIILPGSAKGWLGRAPGLSKPFPTHGTRVHGEPAGTRQSPDTGSGTVPRTPAHGGHPSRDMAGPQDGDSLPGRQEPSQSFGRLSVFYADGETFASTLPWQG